MDLCECMAELARRTAGEQAEAARLIEAAGPGARLDAPLLALLAGTYLVLAAFVAIAPLIARHKGHRPGPWIVAGIWCMLVAPAVVFKALWLLPPWEWLYVAVGLAAGATFAAPFVGAALLRRHEPGAPMFHDVWAHLWLAPRHKQMRAFGMPIPDERAPARVVDRRAWRCPRCGGVAPGSARACPPCTAELARGERP